MPWSYSLLSAYELCPRKFASEKILKTVPEKKFEQREGGIDEHHVFDQYMRGRRQLPLSLRHHAPYLDRIKRAPGEQFPEQKVGLTRQYVPTGFFDADVWYRGIIDFAKVNEEKHRGVVIDWKFGKNKVKDNTQLLLFCATLFAYYPELETVTAGYYYARLKLLQTIKIHRHQVMAIWERVVPRVERMEQAVEMHSFPPRPCFLCKRHCPVTTCEYNGEAAY